MIIRKMCKFCFIFNEQIKSSLKSLVDRMWRHWECQTSVTKYILSVATKYIWWYHRTRRGINELTSLLFFSRFYRILITLNKMLCKCLHDVSQIERFMWPTWGPPGSCRSQVGPMLAPWTLLSGMLFVVPKSVLRGAPDYRHYFFNFINSYFLLRLGMYSRNILEIAPTYTSGNRSGITLTE